MITHMKKNILIGFFIVVIAIVGYGVKMTFFPSLPENFKMQAMDFLNKAEKLDTTMSNGTNYEDYRSQANDVAGSFSSLLNLWPKNLKIDGTQRLGYSILFWITASDVWNDQISEKWPLSDKDLEIIKLANIEYPNSKIDVPSSITIEQEYTPLIKGLLTDASQEYNSGKSGLFKEIN